MRNFSFYQQVLTGFIITLLSASVLAIVSYNSIKGLQLNADLANHSEQIIRKTDVLLQNMIDAESNNTKYLITGEDHYRQAYNHLSGLIIPSIQELRELVAEDVSNMNRADSLSYYASQKLSEMHQIAQTRAEKGYDAITARKLIYKSGESAFMSKIKSIIIEFKNTENEQARKIKLSRSQNIDQTIMILIFGSVLVFCLILVLLLYITKTFKNQKISEENLIISNLEIDKVLKENEQQNWILEGAVVVDIAMRGAQTLDERCLQLITEICKYIKADLGAVYIADPTGELLHIEASYAFPKEASKEELKSEVGLIGQAVTQKKGLIFRNIPKNYIKVSSGLGNTLPEVIFIQPIFVQDQLVAVIELAFAGDIKQDTDRLFDKVAYSIGISIQAAQARVSMHKLVERTQQQAEELESQQEELRTTNEELIYKTHALQASEEELRVQQEELRQTNSELEEKAGLLEEQNRLIHDAREAIMLKVAELERSSKYKTEFLANMSHELRTPLNSILILARILKENKNENLLEEQIKYAGVIYNAGSDLLALINDILDLAKIESGKIDLDIESVKISEIQQDLELLFAEVAENKKIIYTFNIAADVPVSIVSDRLRLEQVLKNLLSNAFKFTPEKGAVSVDIQLAEPGHQFLSDNLQEIKGQPVLAFTVKDTGIGIKTDKQKIIFEAFQQADGSTSRKYGGTGLGLSISREIAAILGGEINVESRPGEGSSFTLYLPVSWNEGNQDTSNQASASLPESGTISAKAKVLDTIKLPAGKENTILIIEDDATFAEVLKDYATERGFKTLLAYQGDEGLKMAREHLPNAIVLDIMLPVMDGWAVLKHLKNDPKTKDIPVHLMSAGDERPVKAKKEGAIGFMKKPVDKERLDEAFNLLIKTGTYKLNKVLIIEDHEIQSENLRRQLIQHDVIVLQAFDGTQALNILQKEQDFDCIILDLTLPDMSGLDLLDKIKSEEKLFEIPVVINTAMELDQDGVARIMKHTHAMVLKNQQSNDRLIDEVNLFMNKIKKDVDATSPYTVRSQEIVTNSITSEKALENKSVLIVDDDMRNIFALTSALQIYDLKIEIAVNGLEALKKLDEKPDTDIVLMDIMMPEMDGYETMREIRKQNRFNKLPIIALTAKAMKNDREKCISAGANDYISKPVDIDKLLSLIRVWLS